MSTEHGVRDARFNTRKTKGISQQLPEGFAVVRDPRQKPKKQTTPVELKPDNVVVTPPEPPPPTTTGKNKKSQKHAK